MNRKRIAAIAAVVILALATGTFAYVRAAEKKEVSTEYGFLSNLKNLKEISEIMDIINTKFVGEKEVTREQLMQGAIKGMVEVLDDPHSNYFSKKEYTDFSQDIKGEYAGVGMVVTKQDNILTVVSPIEDTPAAKVGMRPNDKILKIENEATIDIPLDKCVEKLKGQSGTKITITVLRSGVEKAFEVTLERAVIKLKYVKYKMLDNGIGYLRITQFGDDITADVRKAVEDMIKQKMKGLVLDLRNNPGGALPEAIGVASVFIDKSPIVTVKDKAGQVETYNPIGKAYTNFPMVVMINEGSASASEIVAGAVKDHKRGLLLGMKSYGKGSVQSLIPLPDGDALKLTIAKYYTPSGVSIHKKGIVPDIVVEEKDPGALFDGFVTNVMETKTDSKNGAKDSTDKKDTDIKTDSKDKNAKEVQVKKDVQLEQAVNLLKAVDILKK